MQRKVHGRADPKPPNSGCLPLLSRDGCPMNLCPTLHGPLQGGVGRPVAEKSLLTSIGGRVRQTRTEIQTVKLKGHTSSEQVHTNFLLHTPHDRTNQLAVTIQIS